MLAQAHSKFSVYATYLQSLTLLLVRLAFGFQTAESGYGHLHHVSEMLDRFRSWDIPYPTLSVYVSGWSELICGSLLVLGLGTRLISVPLLFNFIVAILAVSRLKIMGMVHGGDYQGAYDTLLNDTAFPFALMMLVMLAFGPGLVSLDALFGRVLVAPAQKSNR